MPRFCTQCGKLLKDDERFCTSCGAPVTDDDQVSQAQENAPFAENAPAPDAVSSADATATQPQPADVTVQSAHQPAPAPQPEVGTTQQWAAANAAAQQPIPTAAPQAGTPTAPKNNNALLIGIIAALVVVIIALVAFFMIKPFDKGTDDSKGTTIEKVKIDDDDDDVSVKGDPNKLDDDAHDAATISEQNVYDQLSSYYSRLSDLDQQVRDCATTFNTYYLKDDRSSRQSASDAAEALEDQISDLKDEVEDLDVPIDSQNYSSWKDIITLYDDLENRIDVICDAWEISLEYSSPTNHKDEIVAPLARDNVAGTNDNKYRLDFEDSYPGAAPVEVK